MKALNLREIKAELKHCSKEELLEICLRMSKFKKENKELLTYLLSEEPEDLSYIESVKSEISLGFEAVNTSSYFLMKKTIRKNLRITKTHIAYSTKKETEIELLLYFCLELKNLRPSIHENKVLDNLYNRQIMRIKKVINSLHEDLHLDYISSLESLGEGF